MKKSVFVLFLGMLVLPCVGQSAEPEWFGRGEPFYDENGKLYTGVDEGEFSDKTKFKIAYKDGKANGLAEFWTPEGIYMRVNMVNGKAEGKMEKLSSE